MTTFTVMLSCVLQLLSATVPLRLKLIAKLRLRDGTSSQKLKLVIV